MACESFGVEFMLTGAPGIRRKYQQVALPQLVVGATRKEGAPSPANETQGAPQLKGPLPTAEKTYAGHSSSNSSSSSSNSSSSREPRGDEGPSESLEESEDSRRRFWRLEDVREDTDIMERPKLSNE